jgi:hypothetical protein
MRGVLAQGMRTIGRKKQKQNERRMSKENHMATRSGRTLSRKRRTATKSSRERRRQVAKGGARDFMRPITQDLYGIPPESVIGSTVASIKNDWKTVFANH